MKYYWLTLILIFIVSTAAMAQQTPPDVTNEQAKATLKTEQKKYNKRKQREEIAKNDQEDRVQTKPRYKREIKHRKRKIKEKINPAPTPVRK